MVTVVKRITTACTSGSIRILGTKVESEVVQSIVPCEKNCVEGAGVVCGGVECTQRNSTEVRFDVVVRKAVERRERNGTSLGLSHGPVCTGLGRDP